MRFDCLVPLLEAIAPLPLLTIPAWPSYMPYRFIDYETWWFLVNCRSKHNKLLPTFDCSNTFPFTGNKPNLVSSWQCPCTQSVIYMNCQGRSGKWKVSFHMKMEILHYDGSNVSKKRLASFLLDSTIYC